MVIGIGADIETFSTIVAKVRKVFHVRSGESILSLNCVPYRTVAFTVSTGIADIELPDSLLD
ncbi:MAG: hypothetical protein M1431_07810 [Candidatus Thermoplasmatota archaeon]|nr:hypothetical protein [Candidatus Thermoplasmatota archaeon]